MRRVVLRRVLVLSIASIAVARNVPLSAQSSQSAPSAQRDIVDGHVSLTTDYLPNVEETLELRARLFVERSIDAGPNVRIFLSGWAEGLIAHRDAVSGMARDAVARPHEAYIDLRAGPIDLRAGMANVVWGRLDEVQPSDVVNPLDISRYLFEGRAEARLPVPIVRARWVRSEAFALEGVWVPLFRRGRADVLDEESSPFSLLTARDLCSRYPQCPPGPIAISVDRREPARTLRSSQGGVRLSATTGRADWSVTAWRGFESFGVVTLGEPPPLVSPGATTIEPTIEASIEPTVVSLIETFPRFTMIASDVEAVSGPWTIRGEVAAFLDETLQTPDAPTAMGGHSVEGGGSVERKAGDYRFNSAILLQHRRASPNAASNVTPPAAIPAVPAGARADATGRAALASVSASAAVWSDTDISLVTGAQRSFARDTRRLLLFGVWNVADSSGFLRTIGAWSLRDNLWLEGSVGWFFGEGTDTLSRFGTRDFAYVRLKAYF